MAEPWCVCNNKTTETYAYVDGNSVPAWVSTGLGFCLLGAVTFLLLKFHQEQLGKKP